MKGEKVAYRPETPTAEGVREFFAELFVSLDERPRPITVTLAVPGLTIDWADANPVFRLPGAPDARADFRRRWLPEHPIPLVANATRELTLHLIPTTGNRVKVRAKNYSIIRLID